MIGDKEGIMEKSGLDLKRELRIIIEILIGVIEKMKEKMGIIGEKGKRIIKKKGIEKKIEKIEKIGKEREINDIELEMIERRREIVIKKIKEGMVEKKLVEIIDGEDKENIEEKRRIEIERIEESCSLRREENEKDINEDMVDEDKNEVWKGNGESKIEKRMDNEKGMKERKGIKNLKLDLRKRSKGWERVEKEKVDGEREKESIGDLKRMLKSIGMRDKKILKIEKEIERIERVKRMLRIEEWEDEEIIMRLRDGVKGKSGFKGNLRKIDLKDK